MRPFFVGGGFWLAVRGRIKPPVCPASIKYCLAVPVLTRWGGIDGVESIAPGSIGCFIPYQWSLAPLKSSEPAFSLLSCGLATLSRRIISVRLHGGGGKSGVACSDDAKWLRGASICCLCPCLNLADFLRPSMWCGACWVGRYMLSA